MIENETLTQLQASRRIRVMDFCKDMGNTLFLSGVGMYVAVATHEPTIIAEKSAGLSIAAAGLLLRVAGEMFEEHLALGNLNES